MKKAEMEQVISLQDEKLTELKNDLAKMVEEQIALGEDMRGRVFLLEDLDGFTLTPVMDEHNSFVSKEIFSLDGYHISRGKGNIWHIITPYSKEAVPVEINDMFEGIMILRALGLKRLTFHGLMEKSELFDSFKEDFRKIEEMRDERMDNEEKSSVNPEDHEQSK